MYSMAGRVLVWHNHSHRLAVASFLMGVIVGLAQQARSGAFNVITL